MSFALLSPCGRYRYTLTRVLNPAVPKEARRTVLFLGVNPSTADGETDDASIRKMCGFARHWGFDRVQVGNVFGWRATDVRELARTDDPVGPENDHHLEQLIGGADLVVPCWGREKKVPPRLQARFGVVGALIAAWEKPTGCLGLTQCGSPRHPLMLGYGTLLEPWP
jgi:hypothetical protein